MKKLITMLAILGLSNLSGAFFVEHLENTKSQLSNINLNWDSQLNAYSIISCDYNRFDVWPGYIEEVDLSNLLTLFNDLQKIHFETGKIISGYNLPEFAFISDNKELVGLGQFDMEAAISILDLVNADNVEFISASLKVINLAEPIYKINLRYSICGVKQLMKLTEISNQYLPSKQNNLLTNIHFSYFLL
ncbi:hypothetical protein [Spiroplasma chrysopicola]|uniref:Chitinase n=1 Tax=Spiroplasma chrysopicola DF-1 TaxID=1276227 RepID=R4UGK0_9MOLU|nr:hypothetical protein [Spiroplasma chrysopicola]AGM25255.1 hypothetical protein SCHRY_v1c06790 [Spiroplasma chrysopicola DF-1]